MTERSLDLLQGTLELLILKTLQRKEALHGFGILDWIRSATGQALEVEEGALYPALHRMEKRGWLTSEWGVSEKGRRAKYYRLTAEGEAARRREADHWDRYVEAVARIGGAVGGAPEGA